MSKWMDAVFSSDFHLDKLERFFPDHLERQKIEIRKPLLYAIKNGIRNVFFAGDIAEDPELSDAARAMLFEVLMEFDGRLDIHIILGNHDFAHSEHHSLHSLETLCKGKKRRFTSIFFYPKAQHVVIEGINFNMLPYPHKADVRPYKGPAINVAHLEWDGAVRDNGKTPIKGYNDGRKGKDVWWIGHLHTPQYLKQDRVLYCGTLYQTNFGETTDKSFCHCKVRMKGNAIEHKFQRINHRPHFQLLNVKIEQQEDFAKLLRDPNVQYKLWLSENVRLPKGFLAEYTNVVDTLGNKAVVTEEGDTTSLMEQSAGSELTITSGLRAHLKRQGLDKPQRKRAVAILGELGIT